MKLIAIDLDGTLLNKESIISNENRAAIKRALDAGILVTICTGRATFDVKALLEGLDIPIIAANGGTVHDKGYRLISRTLMDQEAGKAIADYLLSKIFTSRSIQMTICFLLLTANLSFKQSLTF